MSQRIQKSSTLSRSGSSSFDIIFCGNGTLWWRLASQACRKAALTSISFAFLILTFQYPYFMQWFYLISGEVQHIHSNVGKQTMVLIIDLLIVASMKWHGKMRVLFYSPAADLMNNSSLGIFWWTMQTVLFYSPPSVYFPSEKVWIQNFVERRSCGTRISADVCWSHGHSSDWNY